MRRPPLALAGIAGILTTLALAGGGAPLGAASPSPTTNRLVAAPDVVTPDPLGGIDDTTIPEDMNTELPAGGGATGHVVTVRVAADEEWRNQFGADWKKAANTAIETADDRMFEVFGIDLQVKEYVGYNSADSMRDNECDLLGDLKSKVGFNGKDVVLGFLGQGTFGGCAYRDGRYAVTLRSSSYKEWKVVRHEVSHLFNADDRYINYAGDNPNHEDDVMEDPYDHYNRWMSPDHGIIDNNVAKFD